MFRHHRRHEATRFSHPFHEHFGRIMRERGGRHGRRGERMFDHGDLRWVLLKLIAEKPSHGYELIKCIETWLGGAYSPSPGVIYPTLTLLEELGLVSAEPTEGGRRAYAITDAGTQALADNAAVVEAIFARSAATAERMGGRSSPRIVRAMENLRTALRLKLEHGVLTEAQIEAVTVALDHAAGVIEGA